MGSGEDFDTVLAAAQSGAEWAFATLYHDLNPRLLRYLTAGAPGVAEDLASETWLGAARQLPGFRGGEDAFRAWMFTIAHRRLVKHWRDTKRHPFTPTAGETMGEYPATDDPAAEVVDTAMAQEAVRQIVALLAPAQAEVVLLRVLGGLDVGQVAKILDKRTGTVRVLQHKALSRLAGMNFSLEGVTP